MLQAAWDLVLWVHYVLVTLPVMDILRLFPTLPYFELHSGVIPLCVCFLHTHVSIPIGQIPGHGIAQGCGMF